MKKLILLILSVTTWAWATPSPYRAPGEEWTQIRDRFRTQALTEQQDGQEDIADAFGGSATSVAKSFSHIDFTNVPDVGSEENLKTIFRYLRDTRFIRNQRSAIQERRLSWLYPDDGCYVRAELMASYAEKQNWPSAKKIFAFGDLAARTNNSPGGIVRWWYHVAPLYRTGNVVWVLDPSVDYNKPLTIQQWKNLISIEGRGAEKFSLCATHTYDPDEHCANPRRYRQESVESSQRQFHFYEWDRILEMGRDPYKEL